MEVRPAAGDGAGDRAGAGTAAAAVRDYLLEQVSALHWAVADGDVHDARVACRRARSVLLAHADLVVPPHRAPLAAIAASARDLGRDLSPVRDAEVVEEVVRSWAAEGRWPADRLHAALRIVRPDGAGDETETALERARTGLLGLADRVATLAASPVWGPAGSEPAVTGLRPGRAREAARLVDRVRTARAGDHDPAAHPRWHDVRKAAKRLRYTAEVAQQAGDREAGAQALSARRLQTALGDLQDLRLVGDRLAEAGTAAQDATLVGELTEQVEHTSSAARSDLAAALADTVGDRVGGSVSSHHHRSGGPDVTLPVDTDPAFADYAHPERLVSTTWLQEHLGDEGLVVVESDEDVLLYETGHVPGAVKVDWHLDLNDTVTRDYVDGEAFAALMSSKGISRDSTIVVYGDKNNWWAAYALWVFSLFGHEDVRLLDGGRTKWLAEERETTTDVPSPAPTDYPVVERDDTGLRAFLDDVRDHLGKPMVDVRSPEEYSGERTHMPAYPEEGALRGGHIPGAQSVPWARAAAEDGTFKRRADLEAIYQDEKGLAPTDDVVAYCRIGERSSHTWFVLTHLLGFEKVRNYDGSWTEWGNVVRVPIVKGTEPGAVPSR